MKRIVYTILIDQWRRPRPKAFDLWRFEESVERYCQKHGAERVVDRLEPNDIHPWYRRYQRIEELFSGEECEVLHLDADIFITKRAPWIELKEHKWLGLTRAMEKTFLPTEHSFTATRRFYDNDEDALWHSENRFYFNAGVQLYRFPKARRLIRDYLRLMEKWNWEWRWEDPINWQGGDQGALAYVARIWWKEHKIQIFPRGYNQMAISLTEQHRFKKDTFFVHMAGRGDDVLFKLHEEKFALPISLDFPEGLGDTIAKITNALGIKPCKGCKGRQKKLNKAISWRRRKK